MAAQTASGHVSCTLMLSPQDTGPVRQARNQSSHIHHDPPLYRKYELRHPTPRLGLLVQWEAHLKYEGCLGKNPAIDNMLRTVTWLDTF